MLKLGVCRPLDVVYSALIVLSRRLLILLDQLSSTTLWVSFGMFVAIGEDLSTSNILIAKQIYLSSSEIASVTGALTFIRSFAFVWVVTFPTIIFNG